MLTVLAAFGLQVVTTATQAPGARAAAAAADPCAPRSGVLPANCVPWLRGWRPPLGPVFNDPLGTPEQQRAIVTRLIAAIDHTRRGATIKIAVYSFDRTDVIAALRRAHRRGVQVQVIVNKTVMSDGVRALRRVLHRNADAPSFVIACDGRCRRDGSGGNMHAKVYAFSRTGGAQYFVMTGSGNLTSKGVYRQWNDSFAVANDKALYDTWSRMFDQMAHQRQQGRRKLTYTTSTREDTYTFQRQIAGSTLPSSAVTATGRYRPNRDLAYKRIRSVDCRARRGYGINGRTVIRIAMYGMFKARGEGLAALLVRKKRQGCNIKIIMSVPGGHTYKMMERAGIPLRSGDWAFAERVAAEEDGISGWGPRIYTHLKYMAINGTVKGRSVRSVTTGSENWDGLSMANEEVVLTLQDTATYRAYVRHWNGLWGGRATHRMGVQPLRAP